MAKKTYNQAEFIESLERRRNHDAIEREIKIIDDNTVAVITLHPDDFGVDDDLYGTWENRIDAWRIDRKDQILYGEYITREYRYITRSEKRAVERATKRAKRDRFQLDESSEHQAEMSVYRDGNYTTVEFSGYQVMSDDIWVNSRFDSWRDARYFAPPIENYRGSSESDLVTYCLQDHHRMEELCNDEWQPAYAHAVAYYKGIEIGDTSLGGFEAEYGMADNWITDTLADLDIDKLRQDKIEELRSKLAHLED